MIKVVLTYKNGRIFIVPFEKVTQTDIKDFIADIEYEGVKFSFLVEYEGSKSTVEVYGEI